MKSGFFGWCWFNSHNANKFKINLKLWYYDAYLNYEDDGFLMYHGGYKKPRRWKKNLNGNAQEDPLAGQRYLLTMTLKTTANPGSDKLRDTQNG